MRDELKRQLDKCIADFEADLREIVLNAVRDAERAYKVAPKSPTGKEQHTDVRPLKAAHEELRKSLIDAAMNASGGNIQRAANSLKITRQALSLELSKRKTK